MPRTRAMMVKGGARRKGESLSYASFFWFDFKRQVRVAGVTLFGGDGRGPYILASTVASAKARQQKCRERGKDQGIGQRRIML